MAQQFVTVHYPDPDDQTILAVIYPPARIAGTDDASLVRQLQAALDHDGMFLGPDWKWSWRGPAARHTGVAWAIAVLNGLLASGLRGDAVGFTWPVLDHPDDGRVY